MNCDQCEALMINGVFCHETGCPNSYPCKRYIAGQWWKVYECRECGSMFCPDLGESCCNME